MFKGEIVMSALYKTKVLATGGRAGRVRSEDGLLDIRLTLPAAMGGTGDATNPEQLFAAGYAACFENAVIHVARRFGHQVRDEDVEVVAEVGISARPEGGFMLSASLDVVIANLEQMVADQVVQAAHVACPYSNAVKGNIAVAIETRVR